MKKIAVIFILSIVSFLPLCSQVASNVEVLPTNIGGKAEFKRIFEQELVYPEAALKNNISGKVTVSFDIKKDSSISNVKVISCGNQDLDAEGLRLFNLFLWVPARKEGQCVGTSWTVVFDFVAEKYQKICKKRGYTNFKYIADAKIDSTGKIYTSGVQMPMYEKGNFALQDFIKENLEYPRQAQLSNLQGTVVLSFVVEPSGLMTNIGIEKSVGGGCDQEAIRVLEQIKWYPGKYNGKLARVRMTFPVYFILNEDFKNNASGEQK